MFTGGKGPVGEIITNKNQKTQHLSAAAAQNSEQRPASQGSNRSAAKRKTKNKGSVASAFRREKTLNKAFFNRVFATGVTGSSGIGDFYDMLKIAIDEHDTKLVTKIKQCLDAQFACVPRGEEGQALLAS